MLTQRMHSPFSAQLFTVGMIDCWRDCSERSYDRAWKLFGFQALSFLRARELAWRDGSRVQGFAGAPAPSALFAPLQRVGVQPDGKGAVVYQRDLHVCTELAGSHVTHAISCAHQAGEIFVQAVCLVGRAGLRERGAISLFATGVERELGNYQHIAVDVGK